MQFLQNDKGGAERIPAFMLVPRLKMNKDFERLVYLNFSVKLKADVANLCDEKIRRAFEDCEFLDRKIDSVRLKCEIENTDIDFYELPESKHPSFQLKNVIVKGLFCERTDGTTYLYFGCEAALSKTLGLGKWAVERFGSEMFAEFRPSQGALAFPMVGGIVDAPQQRVGEEVPDLLVSRGVAESLARMVNPVAKGDGITSMEIRVEGHEPVVIDKQAAINIQKNAKAKGRKS